MRRISNSLLRVLYFPPPHLSPGLQQQAGAVGTRLDAGFVKRSDVVHRDRIDRRAALYQLLKLEGSAVRSRFVQGGPVRPETSKKTSSNVRQQHNHVFTRLGLTPAP